MDTELTCVQNMRRGPLDVYTSAVYVWFMNILLHRLPVWDGAWHYNVMAQHAIALDIKVPLRELPSVARLTYILINHHHKFQTLPIKPP